MDLFRSMECFVTVIDQGGFAAAGRALGQSKANVSRALSGLEDHLGVRLLQRSTRTHSLTEEGERYLVYARELLEGNERIETELGERRATPRGRLKINAPLSYGERYLGPLLPEFAKRYRDIEMDVTLSDRFVDLVEEGYDVAVRIGGDQTSRLVGRQLGVIRHGFFASPDYLASAPPLEEAGDLKSHACLVHVTSGIARPWSFRGKTVTPRPSMISNNGDILRSAAVGGCGVTILPTFFVEDDIKAGRLVDLTDECAPNASDIDSPLMAVYPERRHLSLKVRVFVDYLVEVLG